MSPVFAHGRLRLYLLKLLDEAPRHGYEVIRLLEERFHGLYAPSAGTVYPRLAKLEQEGLVAHTVEGGRKVYRITDAGRAELATRATEIDALEAEIRDSVSQLANQIREDVRDSAQDLREEMRRAAKESQRQSKGTAKGWGPDPVWERGDGPWPGMDHESWQRAKEDWRQAKEQAKEQTRQAKEQARSAREEARAAREQTRAVRDQVRAEGGRRPTLRPTPPGRAAPTRSGWTWTGSTRTASISGRTARRPRTCPPGPRPTSPGTRCGSCSDCWTGSGTRFATTPGTRVSPPAPWPGPARCWPPPPADCATDAGCAAGRGAAGQVTGRPAGRTPPVDPGGLDRDHHAAAERFPVG
jgi:DNA-binding PadR family transcriptional regulator